MNIMKQLADIQAETKQLKAMNPDYAVNVEAVEYQLVIATPEGVEPVSEPLPFSEFMDYIQEYKQDLYHILNRG